MAGSWSACADRFLFSLLPHLNESVHIRTLEEAPTTTHQHYEPSGFPVQHPAADTQEVLTVVSTSALNILTPPPSINLEQTPQKDIVADFFPEKQSVQRSHFHSAATDKEVQTKTPTEASNTNLVPSDGPTENADPPLQNQAKKPRLGSSKPETQTANCKAQ
ncbi:uncharacterized protein [Miscanthus floridulus]|uniref:uncharacterized protein isoform X2 n=1 Tax=Miscanthus floridulus TaxID=154761 RepID=UPI003457B771